jgi:hypothetical protein
LNDTKDVGIGADAARPFELEPSVTERLYEISLKAVGKNTWGSNSHPCVNALKHAKKAIEEAKPAAATVEQPAEESTGNAATVEEQVVTSTGGAGTEEHATTKSKEGTVPEADVQAVVEDEESEGSDASGVVNDTDKPPPAQAQKTNHAGPKPNVAINDVVYLSLGRNKKF